MEDVRNGKISHDYRLVKLILWGKNYPIDSTFQFQCNLNQNPPNTHHYRRKMHPQTSMEPHDALDSQQNPEQQFSGDYCTRFLDIVQSDSNNNKKIQHGNIAKTGKSISRSK